MSTPRQVTCINKKDRASRHEAINHIGGSWGKETQKNAIEQIEKGSYSYFVQVGDNKANVQVATHLGNKYLKTDRDTTTVDNLLSLKECV